MNDFTIYSGQDSVKAALRKALYIKRHKSNENWSDPKSAGALSRYILWNRSTVESSLADYKRRFPGV